MKPFEPGGRADDDDLPPEPEPLEDDDMYFDGLVGIYCWECMQWTNGEIQFEEHSSGKKHRKQVKRNDRLRAST